MIHKSQHNFFLNGEGDSYFLRNQNFILNQWQADRDVPLDIIRRHKIKPRRSLDIGAANGFRLEKIRQFTGTQGFAVEPSQQAIRDGKKRFPHLRFYRGVVSSLPAPIRRLRFDLVVVQFVLHWVGREDLFKALTMIDEVLEDGGYLILGDFQPPQPEKVPYHHIPGEKAWTYKQDYARIFIDSCLYQPLEEVSGIHGGGSGTASRATSVHLFRKQANYITKTL